MNKNANTQNASLEAKSRWVVFGHTDELKSMPTEEGGVRSDAAVAPQEALRSLLSGVVEFDWERFHRLMLAMLFLRARSWAENCTPDLRRKD